MDGSTFIPITLAVNELATNAIKYAFEEAKSGQISVVLRADGDMIIVTVDDDGLPLPDPTTRPGNGSGLRLIARLIGSVGGTLHMPASGSKMFTLVLPRHPSGK